MRAQPISTHCASLGERAENTDFTQLFSQNPFDAFIVYARRRRRDRVKDVFIISFFTYRGVNVSVDKVVEKPQEKCVRLLRNG